MEDFIIKNQTKQKFEVNGKIIYTNRFSLIEMKALEWATSGKFITEIEYTEIELNVNFESKKFNCCVITTNEDVSVFVELAQNITLVLGAYGNLTEMKAPLYITKTI